MYLDGYYDKWDFAASTPCKSHNGGTLRDGSQRFGSTLRVVVLQSSGRHGLGRNGESEFASRFQPDVFGLLFRPDKDSRVVACDGAVPIDAARRTWLIDLESLGRPQIGHLVAFVAGGLLRCRRGRAIANGFPSLEGPAVAGVVSGTGIGSRF